MVLNLMVLAFSYPSSWLESFQLTIFNKSKLIIHPKEEFNVSLCFSSLESYMYMYNTVYVAVTWLNFWWHLVRFKVKKTLLTVHVWPSFRSGDVPQNARDETFIWDETVQQLVLSKCTGSFSVQLILLPYTT